MELKRTCASSPSTIERYYVLLIYLYQYQIMNFYDIKTGDARYEGEKGEKGHLC